MTIVGIAGRIASGKSAISRRVGEALQVPRASFGDTVRSVARERGLPDDDRETLQDLGDLLIAEGWDAFCERVVRHVDWSPSQLLVVDGIRHLGAVDSLTTIAAPDAMRVIFVDTPWDLRLRWMLQRGVSEDEARHADAHPNEAEVGNVRLRADAVVGNVRTLDEVVADVVAIVRTLA